MNGGSRCSAAGARPAVPRPPANGTSQTRDGAVALFQPKLHLGVFLDEQCQVRRQELGDGRDVGVDADLPARSAGVVRLQGEPITARCRGNTYRHPTSSSFVQRLQQPALIEWFTSSEALPTAGCRPVTATMTPLKLCRAFPPTPEVLAGIIASVFTMTTCSRTDEVIPFAVELVVPDAHRNQLLMPVVGDVAEQAVLDPVSMCPCPYLAGSGRPDRKPLPTFSDALAAVRRHWWRTIGLSTSCGEHDIIKVPRRVFQRLHEAACHAA